MHHPRKQSQTEGNAPPRDRNGLEASHVAVSSRAAPTRTAPSRTARGKGHTLGGSRRSGGLRAVLLASAVMLVAAGCGSDSDSESGPVTGAAPSTTSAERPSIAVTTDIWADVVSNVVCGDLAEVTSLIPAGADPHRYELSLADQATIDDAHLVVSNGLALEESIEDVLETVAAEGVLFEMGDHTDTIEYESLTGESSDDHDHADDDHADDDHADDDHADDDHADEDDHADDDHADDDHADSDDDHADDDHADEDDDHADDDHADDDHADDDHADDDHADDDHADSDDDHADDDHADDDHADDDHADDDHADDDHADEDDHADDDHADDDHADDDHADDDHADDDHADDDHADDDHADDHSDDDHADEDAHDHAHGVDPHFWFDPTRVAMTLDALVDVLVAETGLDRSAVESCAADYEQQLNDVDEEVSEILAGIPDARRKLVTNHEALGYFGDRYGFELVGTVIPVPSGMAEATPRHLAELAETIEHTGVPAIFSEVQHSDADAQALADRLDGVEVYTLLTGSLGPAGSGAETYLDFMRHNARTIAEALG